MVSYRQVGGKLGAFIRAHNPTTRQIQGVLADLLAEDELFLTMKNVVERPVFLELQKLAGSGTGAIHLDALLGQLEQRYLPGVVDDVRQLICGMLDLPSPPELKDPSSRTKEDQIAPHHQALPKTMGNNAEGWVIYITSEMTSGVESVGFPYDEFFYSVRLGDDSGRETILIWEVEEDAVSYGQKLLDLIEDSGRNDHLEVLGIDLEPLFEFCQETSKEWRIISKGFLPQSSREAYMLVPNDLGVGLMWSKMRHETETRRHEAWDIHHSRLNFWTYLAFIGALASLLVALLADFPPLLYTFVLLVLVLLFSWPSVIKSKSR